MHPPTNLRAFRWAVALVVLLCSLGLGKPEALPIRRARFVESAGRVQMQIELRELLKRRSRDAFADLASGFETRFVYEFVVHEWKRGGGQKLVELRRELTVHYDPWREVYVCVLQAGSDDGVQRFELARQRELREVATALEVDLGSTARFVRGDARHYFVHVRAWRNPKSEEGEPRDQRRFARSSTRDLSMFARWVRLFVRSGPEADAQVEVRTNGFYLPHPDESRRRRTERRRARRDKRK